MLKRWLVWSAAALLGLYVLLLLAGKPSTEPIGPRTYDQIRLGMTEKAVESLIGFPPGIHRAREPDGGIAAGGNHGQPLDQHGVPTEEIGHLSVPTRMYGRTLRLERWWGTDYAIFVVVDEQGYVVGKSLLKVHW